jgi:tetratricopeptide (TPR) repeat protein
MAEPTDPKGIDHSVDIDRQTLYQLKLKREQSKLVNTKKAMVLIGGLGIILIAVIFFLPNAFQKDETEVNADVRTEIDPEVLSQKPIAEAIFTELTIRKDSIRSQGIYFWGDKDWESILSLEDEGDTAFASENYDKAVNQYRKALQKLSDLELSIPGVLSNALKLGQSSILGGNKNDAIANFEIALAIDGNNLEAKQGLDRALKLDKVIENSTKGEIEFQKGNFLSAIESFKNALIIDPNWEPANSGLDKSNIAYEEMIFQESISQGYEFLVNESFEDAEKLFNQALSIRQGSIEALQALDEVNLKKIASLTKSLKYKALIAEVNEDYELAKRLYEQILEIDKNVEEVKQSLYRVEDRISLISNMKYIINMSDYYSEDKVFNQAQQILKTARNIDRIGQKMAKLLQTLDSLIRTASVSLDVIIESDQLTEVKIFKVAQMGSFKQKALSLRPGIYTAQGSRKGYKDQIIEFRVGPDSQGQRISIICNEKI